MIPRVLLVSALVLPLVALVPAAQADDPCTSGSTLVSTRFAVAGVFTGNCAGVYAAPRLDCFPVHWGVMTDVAGVGGHWSCHVMAYVAPGSLIQIESPDLLP